MLAAAITSVSPEFIVAIVVGVVIALGKYTPLLDRFKNQSAADAASELLIADRTNARQAAEIAELRGVKVRLEQEALNPIFDALKQNAELQAETLVQLSQVIDRLAHHNGSFKHVEESLGLVVEGLKAITGTIAELHDLPLNPTQRRTG